MYHGHMTTSTEIVNRIEHFRKSSGKSIIWLSETTGIADKTLRRRLVAPESFTFSELSAICSALEVELEILFVSDFTEQVAA